MDALIKTIRMTVRFVDNGVRCTLFTSEPTDTLTMTIISPVTPRIDPECQLGVLLLADGTIYSGYSFGADIPAPISGECVFQTGMVGYPESLTDPSYRGQILIPTYPLIGNYGVPDPSHVTNCPDSSSPLPTNLESTRVQASGLIVSYYSPTYSHHKAVMSLGDWLRKDNVPALYGIDTRALTKKIRQYGVILGKILLLPATFNFQDPSSTAHILQLAEKTSFADPNAINLVAQVSIPSPRYYNLPGFDQNLHPTIIAVDTGMKVNQIRSFISRNARLLVVPWDYPFYDNLAKHKADGIFLSNGPGDPKQCVATIQQLKKAIDNPTVPIFGICLGHQLLALAAGAETKKMVFGNRGHNIPCRDLRTKRCYITSQNHGYAVQADTLPDCWEELFINVNDRSNEGIIHKTLPFFSVQFHPEACPGPQDTEFLFDVFLNTVRAFKTSRSLVPYSFPDAPFSTPLPDNPNPHLLLPHIKKVLILGSGGLSIGQAGEFDYSGSQAIKALKEEGIYTVLINPNIATIQTSKGLADKVYFLPLHPDFVRRVIEYERPDGIYVTFGGQTALNVGVKMKDEFEKLGVRVLGTPIDAIIATEDRQIFADRLAEINEKCAKSASATFLEDAIKAAKSIGYPVICRAAYTLGGLGSGFANNEEELVTLCQKAFSMSPQVLVERSMKGWKEIEYEVVRDAYDNCITVCNMENFDPLGIHTGDSIVVAPSQTLSDHDYQMLRNTAVKVIRHLGIVGECNIQYALNPDTDEYCIIEVNARLSRSSALASKATGYPLAFVAAKLGLGIRLDEILNHVTKQTWSCFEPSLDYCVVKIPRWDLRKFSRVSKKINSAMKSVGEVMAIGRSFEEAIQKGIRCLDLGVDGFMPSSLGGKAENIDEALSDPSDERLFVIANAFQAGYTVDRIWNLTKIDKWFLNALSRIHVFSSSLQSNPKLDDSNQLLLNAKRFGYSDKQIASILQTTELAIRKTRKDLGILPCIKQIDTVAAEFPCPTNYLYITYQGSEHDVPSTLGTVIVLGSGVYRIGSSVEFDWCAVRCVRTLRSPMLSYKTVMINYNPETVSTDFDEVDKLYFENIQLETVMDVYEYESALGVIVSMGGQMPNNIALSLHRQSVRILGTSPEQIDQAENRYKFSRLLDSIGVDQPSWQSLTSYAEAEKFCSVVGYPVLVRPSYVLSGAAMNVVFSSDDLHQYLMQAAEVSKEHPVVITKFIEEAKEIEMDAVGCHGKLIASVITEHVENAGVHSGDATLILPPQDLDQETMSKIEIATAKIAAALNVSGPMNIQFIAKNQEIKVIECNLRASRSFPFISKVLDIDMVALATLSITGHNPNPVAVPNLNCVAVKVPQFSFTRLSGADPVLGVEMASTGEVACFGKNKYEAYVKALISSGFSIPKRRNILLSIGSFKEKSEFLPFALKLHQTGYNLFATPGTADFFSEHGLHVKHLEAFTSSTKGDDKKQEYNLERHLAQNLIDLYINLPSKNKFRRPANYMSAGYLSRRMAVDRAIPLITNIKCAKLFVEALVRGFSSTLSFPLLPDCDSKTTRTTISLPGFINTSLYNGDVRGLGVTAQFSSESSPFIDSVMFHSVSDMGHYSSRYHVLDVSNVSSLFEGQSIKLDTNIPILVPKLDGTETLVSILLYASIYHRAVHFSEVYTQQQLKILVAARSQMPWVTFSVPIYAFSCSGSESFWQNIDHIPCISYNVSTPDYGLCWLVSHWTLPISVLCSKLYEQPKKIFGLPDSLGASNMEMEVHGQTVLLRRVAIRGETVMIDGKVVGSVPVLAVGGPQETAPALEIQRPETPHRLVEDVPHKSLETVTATIASTTISAAFHHAHVLSVKQYQRSDLHVLFNLATDMRIHHVNNAVSQYHLKSKTLCLLFYEASTRTQASFEAAMLKLGGSIISKDVGSLSVVKGESFSDTVQTLGSYVDAIALRHPDVGSAQLASKCSPVPIINGGDGAGEHPTQALLDVFTIREELGTVNGLTITFVGDLLHGRTVHSLVRLLSLYSVRFIYIPIKGLEMPPEIVEEVEANGRQAQVMSSLEEALPVTDVLYMTRVQKERVKGDGADYGKLRLDIKMMKNAKERMIVMHPLPRNQEIDPEIDFDPRAAYFRQLKYGLYVRMALLYLMLGNE